MKKFVLFVCLGTTAIFAQGTGPASGPGLVMPIPLFPPELQKFLELSGQQVDAIRRANIELDTFRARKQFRLAQVEAEIREWTAKDPIDAMQLGVRYAEMEGIRREIRDAEKDARAKIRGVLNPAQMAKLKALEDAARLQPLINSAVCENLMQLPEMPVTGITRWFNTTGFVVGMPAPTPLIGCVRAAITPMPMQPGTQP